MNLLLEQDTKRANYLSRILTIKRTDVNDDGIFTICSMLNEILRLNDDTIVQAIGMLDYATMHIAWHHIEFAEKVLPGDTLLFEARSLLLDDALLEIAITVRKKNKGKTVLAAKGNFAVKLGEKYAPAYERTSNLLTIKQLL